MKGIHIYHIGTLWRKRREETQDTMNGKREEGRNVGREGHHVFY
jgi:hypothetical protein